MVLNVGDVNKVVLQNITKIVASREAKILFGRLQIRLELIETPTQKSGGRV